MAMSSFGQAILGNNKPTLGIAGGSKEGSPSYYNPFLVDSQPETPGTSAAPTLVESTATLKPEELKIVDLDAFIQAERERQAKLNEKIEAILKESKTKFSFPPRPESLPALKLRQKNLSPEIVNQQLANPEVPILEPVVQPEPEPAPVLESSTEPAETTVEQAAGEVLDVPVPTFTPDVLIDTTPGSDDIKGEVFAAKEKAVDQAVHDQEVGGGQDVVGLLKHLTQGQDSQDEKHAAPQICEFDDNTGAWLSKECQDDFDASAENQPLAEPPPLLDADQDKEMTTAAPTSGAPEIEEVASAEEVPATAEIQVEPTEEPIEEPAFTEAPVVAEEQEEQEAPAAEETRLEPETPSEPESKPEAVAEASIESTSRESEETVTKVEVIDPEIQVKEFHHKLINEEDQTSQILKLSEALRRTDLALQRAQREYSRVELWEVAA